MTTSLTHERFPYLPLTVTIGESTIFVDALIDTGFDGDIVLPAGLIGATAAPRGYNRWT